MTAAGLRNAPVVLSAAKWVCRCMTDSWSLSDDDLVALASVLSVRTLKAGESALTEDGQFDGVWIIHEGLVELVVNDGCHPVLTQVARECDLFGDIAILLDKDLHQTPRAAQATTCLFIPRDAFQTLLTERPAIARLWLAGCASRYADLQARVLYLIDGPLPQRTAALLLQEQRALAVALPQSSLAAMLGAPRPSVNRVLRGFERAGLVSLHYRKIEITNVAELRATAFGDPHFSNNWVNVTEVTVQKMLTRTCC